jgi:hypothetical protein
MANMLAKGPIKECCSACSGPDLNKSARRQHRKIEKRQWQADRLGSLADEQQKIDEPYYDWLLGRRHGSRADLYAESDAVEEARDAADPERTNHALLYSVGSF